MVKWLKKFIAKISNLWAGLANHFKLIKPLQKVPYCIQQIDVKHSQVIIHCYGIRTLIKASFEEVISQEAIIDGLPPLQACYLGYYYGKSQREAIQSGERGLVRARNSMHFLLRFKIGRFKIISLDRYSRLTYLDVRINKSYVESPVKIMQNHYVINNLDPSQACYIGILAGIEVAKHGIEILSVQDSKLFLRVVK